MSTQVKFLPLPKPITYGEMEQPNPIRWQIFLLKDEALIPQTDIFKCKDFFNDLVGVYHNKTDAIYGMDTTKIQLNHFGVFVRLTGLRASFKQNVEAVVNPLLEEKLLFVDVDNGVLTLFPRYLFNNTYLISKVSHLIRLCNIDSPVASFTELQETNKEEHIPNTLQYLTLPEQYQKYWYYAGPSYNGLSEKFNIVVLHNNGYKSWSIATHGRVQ